MSHRSGREDSLPPLGGKAQHQGGDRRDRPGCPSPPPKKTELKNRQQLLPRPAGAASPPAAEPPLRCQSLEEHSQAPVLVPLQEPRGPDQAHPRQTRPSQKSAEKMTLYKGSQAGHRRGPIPTPAGLPDKRKKSGTRAEWEPTIDRAITIQPPLLPLLSSHCHDEVPMATKCESVSMRCRDRQKSASQMPKVKGRWGWVRR